LSPLDCLQIEVDNSSYSSVTIHNTTECHIPLRISNLGFKELCKYLAFYASRYELDPRSFSEWVTKQIHEFT